MDKRKPDQMPYRILQCPGCKTTLKLKDEELTVIELEPKAEDCTCYIFYGYSGLGLGDNFKWHEIKPFFNDISPDMCKTLYDNDDK